MPNGLINPNLLLLAKILLKSENKPKRLQIVELLKKYNGINKLREMAYEALLKEAEELIFSTYDPSTDGSLDKKALTERVQCSLNAYLKNQDQEIINTLLQIGYKTMLRSYSQTKNEEPKNEISSNEPKSTTAIVLSKKMESTDSPIFLTLDDRKKLERTIGKEKWLKTVAQKYKKTNKLI